MQLGNVKALVLAGILAITGCGAQAPSSGLQGDAVGNSEPGSLYEDAPFQGEYQGHQVTAYLSKDGLKVRLIEGNEHEIELRLVLRLRCAGCAGMFGEEKTATESKTVVILWTRGDVRTVAVERLSWVDHPIRGDSVGNASHRGPVTLQGPWGGRGITLDFGATNATYDLDCAHGTIDGQVKLDASGAFEATGTIVAEHGGPSHPDDELDIHPARYTGTVRDNRVMTLSIQRTDTKDSPASVYTLEAGNDGFVHKCL